MFSDKPFLIVLSVLSLTVLVLILSNNEKNQDNMIRLSASTVGFYFAYKRGDDPQN